MSLGPPAKSPRQAAVVAVLGISLGIVWIFAAPAATLADCTAIGGATVCDGDVSHAEVGRRVIFSHGPPGERVGDFVVRPGHRSEGSLPQVVPRPSKAPSSRPLNRADGLTDPRRGEDFGAFQFPSGPPPSGLSSTGPLR